MGMGFTVVLERIPDRWSTHIRWGVIQNCGMGAKGSVGVLIIKTHTLYEPYTTGALKNIRDIDLYNAQCANKTVHE
jgi:hypothetical protein